MSFFSVEVNDALFCEHGLEVCKTCEFDGREGPSSVPKCLHVVVSSVVSFVVDDVRLRQRRSDGVSPAPVSHSFVVSFDAAPRTPLSLPPHYRSTKDGSIMCKAHANNDCKSCCESIISLRQLGEDLAEVQLPISRLEETDIQASQGGQES